MASKPLLLMLASFLLIVSAEWEEELLTQGSTLVPSTSPAYKGSPPPLPPIPKNPSPPPIAKAPPPAPTKTSPPPPTTPPKSPSPPPISKAPPPPTTTPPKSPSPPPISKAPPPPPPATKTPPPVAAPPPAQPPRNREECFPLCGVRCKNHSRKNVCVRACLACCDRCKCVPPGQYGNLEKCGKCYSGMTTRGGKRKCP